MKARRNQTSVYRNKGSRREFLKLAGTASGLAILPRHVLGGRGVMAPSDCVTIAVIGAGGQGIRDMKNLLMEPDVRIVAVADPSRLSPGRKGDETGRVPALRAIAESDLQRRPNGPSPRCSEYSDFRVMLEKEKGIDAVLVAAPDHDHAVAVMAALHLGKHVFCEKPLAHSIAEVRALVETARRAGVATQMGNQGHSSEGIRLTCEWIWDGAIGPVHEVHAWCKNSYYREPPTDRPPLPTGLDWDLWIGPAPYRPYHPAYHPGGWRCFPEFGTGVLGDFACHHLDPAFWALHLKHPESVEAERFDSAAGTFPRRTRMTFQFAGTGDRPPVKLVWYDGGLYPDTPPELEPERQLTSQGHGILLVGEKGKILGDGWSRSPRLIPESNMKAYHRPPQTIARTRGHERDWLDACKGGRPSSASFGNVSVMVESVLMGVIAVRTGEKLYWDGPGMRCTNSTAANDLVKPPYREGWSL